MTKFLAWLTAHGINLASAVALIHMFPNNKIPRNYQCYPGNLYENAPKSIS